MGWSAVHSGEGKNNCPWLSLLSFPLPLKWKMIPLPCNITWAGTWLPSVLPSPRRCQEPDATNSTAHGFCPGKKELEPHRLQCRDWTFKGNGNCMGLKAWLFNWSFIFSYFYCYPFKLYKWGFLLFHPQRVNALNKTLKYNHGNPLIYIYNVRIAGINAEVVSSRLSLLTASISKIYSKQKINTLNCPAINTSAIQKQMQGTNLQEKASEGDKHNYSDVSPPLHDH